jgi:CRP/FNR family transcriptional regulator, cyclic AMP receptor protein
MGTVDVPAGVRVINQGDAADYFYVVRDGALEVTRREADGSERVVGHLAPGEYFGEIGLLQEGVRTASVITMEATELYRVTGDEFIDAVNRGSQVGAALGSTIAWRLASYERRDGPAIQPTAALSGAESAPPA